MNILVKEKQIDELICPKCGEKIKLNEKNIKEIIPANNNIIDKYNKSIQKKIDINLINYKIFRGAYIIFEKDNKVKECKGYNDSLIFEGEYLNGEMNGKGKEYNMGYLIFEGEYLREMEKE